MCTNIFPTKYTKETLLSNAIWILVNGSRIVYFHFIENILQFIFEHGLLSNLQFIKIFYIEDNIFIYLIYIIELSVIILFRVPINEIKTFYIASSKRNLLQNNNKIKTNLLPNSADCENIDPFWNIDTINMFLDIV